MTIVNGYATLAEYKQRYMPGAATDSARDADLEGIIQAVSRLIDMYTGRTFYETSSEARTYTATMYCSVYVDDMTTLTSIETDDNGDGTHETTWTAADYVTRPGNSAPIMWIEVTPWGAKAFPTHVNAVKITGKFGYSSTAPDVVKQACLLQAGRLWARRESPLGVTGPNEYGQLTVQSSGLDGDVRAMLEPYRRLG